MLKKTAEDYSKHVKVDLERKFEPINQSVDDMLTRLDEFEAMVTLVQQERCNAIGLTGSLTEIIDNQNELKQLCTRIDALENLVEHVRNNVDTLENRMEKAEEQFGLMDNANKFKNFLIPLIFKKPSEPQPNASTLENDMFKTEDYFSKE